MTSALVTGDAGFVGRHLVAELLKRGYQVTGVDVNPVKMEPFAVRAGSYFHQTMDCRQWFQLYPTLEFDLVFHCAAVIGGRVGIEDNPLGVAEDIEIDLAFFKWLRSAVPQHAVYYSSSAAYPIALQTTEHRLRENDIQLPSEVAMPDMTYGWAKLTGEYVASFVQREIDTSVHILRPFSGYGSDQSLDYPFPSIIRRVKRFCNPVEIWHNTVRDFIHIDDVIGATFAAIEENVCEPVNLCTGVPTSFRQLANLAILAAQDKDPEYDPPIVTLGGEKPAGVQYRVGDPELLNTFYVPQISAQQGVRKAIWTA